MKVLMIGAHQDDNEFRCGGLAAKLVKKGHDVRFLSLCNGCGGHHILSPEETTATRAKESAAVAKLLGVTYDVWDIDDCSIEPDLETRRRLIRYIRKYSPDVIITHRQNDYHADHRAAGILMQDASYMLIVPHECPDVPAMTDTPVILYNEDQFKNPPFTPDVLVDVTDVFDIKMKIADLNVSQVYEWLPFTNHETVPETPEERFEWLKGMNITADTTDEEILSAPRGYAVRFAKTAARFRKELIERMGEEKGKAVRYAEAYEICPYGGKLTDEIRKEIFEF
ncbi:MAG: PIG-L family deacetylase [Clostridia bacterium]|nr:PIG-L family deacetylase [Clostridia bacterium]